MPLTISYFLSSNGIFNELYDTIFHAQNKGYHPVIWEAFQQFKEKYLDAVHEFARDGYELYKETDKAYDEYSRKVESTKKHFCPLPIHSEKIRRQLGIWIVSYHHFDDSDDPDGVQPNYDTPLEVNKPICPRRPPGPIVIAR